MTEAALPVKNCRRWGGFLFLPKASHSFVGAWKANTLLLAFYAHDACQQSLFIYVTLLYCNVFFKRFHIMGGAVPWFFFQNGCGRSLPRYKLLSAMYSTFLRHEQYECMDWSKNKSTTQKWFIYTLPHMIWKKGKPLPVLLQVSTHLTGHKRDHHSMKLIIDTLLITLFFSCKWHNPIYYIALNVDKWNIDRSHNFIP